MFLRYESATMKKLSTIDNGPVNIAVELRFRPTLNNASDYQTNWLYRTPNPNLIPLVR